MLNWLVSWEFPLALLTVCFVLFKTLELLLGQGGKNPGKPWLNRRDWAAGRVTYTDTVLGTLLTIIAASFTAIFIASLFTRSPRMAIVILSVIAVLLDWTAIHVVRRALQYGRSELELKTLPAVPGGVLAGCIRIARPLIYKEAITVHLACIEHDNNGTNAVTRTIWQESYSLDRYRLGSQVGEIPVFFKIPGWTKPSQVNRYDHTEWKLDVRATTDGAVSGIVFSSRVRRRRPAGCPRDARSHARLVFRKVGDASGPMKQRPHSPAAAGRSPPQPADGKFSAHSHGSTVQPFTAPARLT